MGKRGDIHLNLDFKLLPSPSQAARGAERNLFSSEEDFYRDVARARSDAVRKGIGEIYRHIYSAVFGGKVPDYSRQNGNNGDSYRPDVIQEDSRKRARTDVEVKAFCNSHQSAALCAVPQVENYFAKLIERLIGRKYAVNEVSFDYGFFRYGFPVETSRVRGKYRNGRPRYKRLAHGANLGNFTRSEIVEFVGEATRDLLIVPPNLAVLMFHGLKPSDLPTPSSNGNGVYHKDYWRLGSGDINYLRQGESGLDNLVDRRLEVNKRLGLKEDKIGVFDPEELLLDKLDIVQSESPRIVVNGKYEVKPFKYTRYVFNSPSALAAWNRLLKKRHKEVMVSTLHARDLYQEGREVPF